MAAAPLRGRRLAVLGVLGVLAMVAACGGDDGGATVDEATAAGEVCWVLVDWTDDVAVIVNEVQPRMGEGADNRALALAALDEVIRRTERLAAEEGDLRLPDTEGGRALAEVLAAGQAAALADLRAFRAEVAAIPTPDPESPNYRKAQLVVELEKPRSLVKPDAAGQLGDPALEAALRSEPSCRFVVRA